MEDISHRFVRFVRSTGIVLIVGAMWRVPPATGAPPQLTVSPAPPTGWLSGGEYAITATASSDRELQSFTWSVEGGPSAPPRDMCFPSRSLCPLPSSMTYVLRPAELPDGVRTLSFSASQWGDRVGQWVPLETTQQTFQSLQIDHSAPDAPKGLAALGQTGWRSENRFAIIWTESPPDSGSSFVGATYRICPARNSQSDFNGCVTGRRSGSELDSIDGISVPGTGVWRLQLALEDAMGHLDLQAGATIEELRLDVDAPRLAFLPRHPSDPARVQLSAVDEGSGIASVAIEARRQGESAWRTLTVAEPRAASRRCSTTTVFRRARTSFAVTRSTPLATSGRSGSTAQTESGSLSARPRDSPPASASRRDAQLSTRGR